MITAAAKTVTFFNSVVGVCNESQLHQEIGMVIKFQVGGEKTLLRHLVRSGGRRILSGGFSFVRQWWTRGRIFGTRFSSVPGYRVEVGRDNRSATTEELGTGDARDARDAELLEHRNGPGTSER